MEGKYTFGSPEWADISEPPKDLIRRLLVVDPLKRITIDDALNHPFFQTVVHTMNYANLLFTLYTSLFYFH